jgi:tetratricopeptide (TPR) repeat protein
MVPMENDLKQEPSPATEGEAISETQPTPVRVDPPALDQTQATPPAPGGAEPLDATQAVSLPSAGHSKNLAETQPTPVGQTEPDSTSVAVQPRPEEASPADGVAGEGDEPPGDEPATGGRSWRWLLYAGLGLLLLLAIGLFSGYSGYLSAIDLRLGYESTQVSEEAQRQFDLGIQDMQAGRYDLARQRFEYVIQLNPNFPGITEVLAQVLQEINTTATPTIAPTPTLTPTPDLRGQEELYLSAREAMAGADWTTAIDTLLTLRKRFPNYLTVKIDGLLYMALRNRGVQKISLLSELEGGTYDLALAEGFGPLDVEARNWRDWAVLYTRGASFWDVDWQQAVFYFSQLAQIAPNLMDASRLTAVERYALALIGYGDWLSRQELWCEAQEQYQLSFNLRGNPGVEPTASHVAEQCANPQLSGGTEGEVTLTPTLVPTPGGEVTPTNPPPQEATPTPTQPPPEPTSTETQAPPDTGGG